MKIEIKDGKVYKDGIPIGDLEGSTLKSWSKIAPTVKAAIKAAANNDDLKFVLLEGNPDDRTPLSQIITEKAGGPGPQAISDADLLRMMQERGLAPQAAPRPSGQPTERENRFLTKQQILDGFALIEPPPETLPAMGDKTPAYVEWVQRHATPEQWQKIYGTRIQRKGRLPTIEDHERGEKRARALLDSLPTETTGKKGDND